MDSPTPEIHALNIRSLRNAEFVEYAGDYGAIILKNDPDLLLVRSPYDSYIKTVDSVSALFGSKPSTAHSEHLSALDAARDRLITGLVKLCDAMGYSPNPDKRTAADLLAANLNQYGQRIAQQNYQAETAILSNIVTDWITKPELITAAALIGADEWITATEAANKAFKDAYLDRNTSEAEAAPDTVRDQRDICGAALSKLRSRLNSHLEINEGAAPWSTVAAQLNSLTDKYARLLTGRAGRAGGDTDVPKP